jgi:hypothetical protein
MFLQSRDFQEKVFMSDNSENSKREWELWKAQNRRDLEIWKTQCLYDIASFHNTNMQGQGTLKAALLINGGASVALLAFIGTTIGKDMTNCLSLVLCFSMLLFVFGVLCVAIASGVTYLGGLVYSLVEPVDAQEKPVDSDDANEKKVSKSNFWFWLFNGVAITLVILSYVLFSIGCLNAYFAFINILKT